MKLFKIIISFFIIYFPTAVLAWEPPAASPLGLKLHPRIFIISEGYRSLNPDAFGLTVSEVRKKIAENSECKEKFQKLIDTMDTIYSEDVSAKYPLDSTYAAVNFAFLYIIDPSVLRTSPYNLNFKYSKNEYGYKAIEYGRHIAIKVKAVTTRTKLTWLDYATYDYANNEWYGCTNISLAVVNDWLNDIVTKTDRKLFMDAVINSYDYRYPETLDAFASGKYYGVAQNGTAGVLGLFGDDIDDSGKTYYADKAQELMNRFEEYWIKGFLNLHNKVYDNGSGGIQGTMYNRGTIKNSIIMLLAMSTALSQNYIQDCTYTRYNPYYWLYSVNPRPVSDKYYWIMSADVGPKNAAMSRLYGQHILEFNPLIYALSKNYSQLSSLHKWIKNESGFLSGDDISKPLYRTLIYEILFNDYAVNPKKPSDLNIPLSKNVGNGSYFCRSGFTNDTDTVVTFSAKKWQANDGGHSHRDFANFQIFKYGDLTTRRTVAKDFIGSGNKVLTQKNMWYNTIGVYKADEIDSKGFNTMGYRDGYDYYEIDPDSAAYSVNGANHVGNIIGEDINSDPQNPQYYDYIDYDYSNAWDDSKVDYAEREFVYLRSKGGTNDEYVIVFDRINSVDPAYTKYWLLQSPFSPKLLDNSNQEITMTAENYPNDPDTSGGRWVYQNSSDSQNNIIQLINTYSDNNSHGLMYNKTLLPDSFQINKTGGSGHYWEDANGKTVAVADGDGSLTEREKNYHGTYTMQIQSTTGKNYDKFLNVIQFGDSNTLKEMTQVEKIQTENNNMVGSLILDKVKNHVVLFNPAKRTEVSKVASAVSYTISTTAPSSHFLFNILPNTRYQIKRGEVSFTATSNDIGVLSFEDSAIGTEIKYSIDITDIVSRGISPPAEDDTTASKESSAGTETDSQEDDFTPPVPPEMTAAVLNDNNEVVLTWKENTESDLTEYYVYYGLAARTYNLPVPIGNVTSYTIGNLEEGNTYFFAVAAVDSAGNDSAPGNELQVLIPNVAPVISITSPTAAESYTTKAGSLNISGNASDNSRVNNVTWSKSSGENGTAQGTTTWVISDLLLNAGDNLITVKATDDAGNEGSAKLTIAFTETADDAQSASSADLISNLKTATGTTYHISKDLAVGSKCYTDRSYKFKALPDFLLGATYIITAKGDRYKTGSPFISFDISTNATVYVAHGDAITNKPAWLSSFEDTGKNLVTNVQMSIYAKEFAAGTVELGENGAGESMYSVILVPKTGDSAVTDDASLTSDDDSSSDSLSISDLTVYTEKKYELSSNLAIGNKCYIDRSYKYTEIPESLLGSTYIMTAKGDRYKTGSPFISFDVNKDVTVYIAHYDNITEKPEWLQSFNDTGKDILTNVKMSVFSKDFSSGRIELGENGAGGAMYTVIIVEK